MCVTEKNVRSALQGIKGVQSVNIAPFADVYTLTFPKNFVADEKTIAEVFKGCAYNGRRVEVKTEEEFRKTVGERPRPAAPEDNPSTEGRVALGQKLFFDVRLSAHGKMSCATCHRPEQAFAHPEAMAPAGFNGQRNPRNVPSLVNVGYRTKLFLDGRTPTLEEQALHPIQHPAEMGMDTEALVRRLAAIPEYAEAFRQEFGRAPTLADLTKALASYQRTLLSKDTPFDRFARGEESALSESARRGFVLFRDKASCITCHSGPDFSDGAIRNIGVGWDGKAFKDPGRAQSSGRKGDAGRFRVPPLRELRWTAPYMHDGSLKTLAEVVDYYAGGVPKTARTDLHQSGLVNLTLTDQEKKDLVSFLEALSSDRPPAASGLTRLGD